MTTIPWWIIATFLVAMLAGGAFRLGLVRNWIGLSGAILLALPAFFAGWQGMGWPLEGALLASVGASLLGAMIPEIIREVAQGIAGFLRWLAPIVLVLIVLGFYLGAVGSEQAGEQIASLIVIALVAMAIRSAFRPKRSKKR